MSLSLTQNYTAIVPGAEFAQFVAIGGTEPYVYSVVPGGAGGSVDPDTGDYTSPDEMTAYPAALLYDTLLVTDADLNTATATILVATPIFLFCEILQVQLGLPNDHVYLWDQKIFQPTDSQLYVAVSVPSCNPIGNVNRPASDDSGLLQAQYVSMYARVDIDVISRGPAARDRKEQIILALNSVYSQQQQEANGFYIGKKSISNGFQNLSQIDGAAIPYRYKITYAMQYAVSLTSSVPYFDTFETEQIYTNP